MDFFELLSIYQVHYFINFQIEIVMNLYNDPNSTNLIEQIKF